jgi:hypothetical protein
MRANQPLALLPVRKIVRYPHYDARSNCGHADRRRWATGAYDLPAGVYLDLLRLTQERASTLDGLAGRLREAGAPADVG